MEEELLSDILAAEREIRQQISTLEQETAEWLATLAAEREEELRQEAARQDEALVRALESAERAAGEGANSILAEANAYAARIASLGDGELDLIVYRNMDRLYPEQGHDCQDEQT